VQQKIRESHIYRQATLRIGVATKEPLMGDLRNGQHVGFDVEIGRYIARSLGYEGDQRKKRQRFLRGMVEYGRTGYRELADAPAVHRVGSPGDELELRPGPSSTSPRRA